MTPRLARVARHLARARQKTFEEYRTHPEGNLRGCVQQPIASPSSPLRPKSISPHAWADESHFSHRRRMPLSHRNGPGTRFGVPSGPCGWGGGTFTRSTTPSRPWRPLGSARLRTVSRWPSSGEVVAPPGSCDVQQVQQLQQLQHLCQVCQVCRVCKLRPALRRHLGRTADAPSFSPPFPVERSDPPPPPVRNEPLSCRSGHGGAGTTASRQS